VRVDQILLEPSNESLGGGVDGVGGVGEGTNGESEEWGRQVERWFGSVI